MLSSLRTKRGPTRDEIHVLGTTNEEFRERVGVGRIVFVWVV